MDTPEEETARQMTNAVVYTVLRQDSVEEEDSEMLQAITEIENGQGEKPKPICLNLIMTLKSKSSSPICLPFSAIREQG